MNQRTQTLYSLGIVALLILLNVVVFRAGMVSGSSGNLKVSFLDVGQGDAVFIESPSGIQMLIDGGQNKKVLEELASRIPFDDKHIDLVLATHPDADHIGGLPFVFERFDVATYVSTDNTSDTATFSRLSEAVVAEGSAYIYAERGMFFDLGGGVVATVLFPDRDTGGLEANDSSIIVRVSYGDVEFLLTGDASKSVEEYVVGLDGEALEAEVLKLGHHGSKTSTSKLFLDAVMPKYAVISAGADNRYGHPHKEVVELVIGQNIMIRSTAEKGAITFLSDGVNVWEE